MHPATTAQNLASYGRNGDSTLVHMSPGEIKGIAALFPDRKVHQNPVTGLPEMFDFGDILQLGATAAASFFGTPLMGAAVNGALTTARTGNLGKGIMSGALSYGMGSAMDAFGDAAGAGLAEPAATATDAAGSTAATDTTTAAIENANPNVAAANDAYKLADGANAPTIGSGSGSAATATDFAPASNISQTMKPIGPQYDLSKVDPAALADHAGGTGVSSAGQEAASQSAYNAYRDPSTSWSDKMGMAFDGMQNPANWKSTFVDNWQHTTAPMAFGAMGMMADQGNMASGIPAANQSTFNYTKAPKPNWQATMPGAGYQPGFSPEHKYFAQGGPVALATGGLAGLRQNPVMDRGGYSADAQNIRASLVPGAMVPGSDRGMDDTVPAKADGTKDILLSSGEFIVPADVMAHLGDGNTAAGAKRLEQMIAEIREQKTGSTKQPGKLKKVVV